MLEQQNNNRGFSLIELIVVLSVIAILASIGVPRFLQTMEKAKIEADYKTVGVLNKATCLYRIIGSVNNESGDLFEGILTDEDRLNLLKTEGYLSGNTVPQQKDASFRWEIDNQLWRIFLDDEPAPLSSLGSNFPEISSAMAEIIRNHYDEMGSYGRTWDPYQYTDLGLDPEEWANPIDHVYYRPSGSTMNLRPEEGYQLFMTDMNGTDRVLTYNLNWNLIYKVDEDKWYYHTVDPLNEIDISTIEVQLR